MEQHISQELVTGILAVMQEKLVSIILYGSVARNADTAESDIDIALLMNGSLDRDTEDKLSDFIVEMNLKYDKVFSVIDIDAQRFSAWKKSVPFYSNVNEEGIVLWKTA